MSEEDREEIGSFGLAAMAGAEEEPIDPKLYWQLIPEKRRAELFIILNPLHMEEVVLGSASPRAAANMFRDGLKKAKAQYKDYSKWKPWIEEQERLATQYFSAMKYQRAREQYGTDAVLSPTTVVHLATERHQKLGPGPYDAVVPASPECYQPWMNWVAGEWMLFHKLGFQRECVVSVQLLGKRPKIRKDEAREEVRYRTHALAKKLTSGDNPNWARYLPERRRPGIYQIPKKLRGDIALALVIDPGSVFNYLEETGFPSMNLH